MTSTALVCAGLMAGLSIAVPVGPMSLLCIQRTLASGMRVGLCTGLGAATVNVVYAGIVLFGLGQVAPILAAHSRALGIAGGLFLLWTAARTALRPRTGQDAAVRLSPLAAYASAVVFNVTNPMSLLLIVALLSPVAAAAPAAVPVLLGLFAAAAGWWLCLTGSVALLRRRISPAVLHHVNQGAAALLTIYGAVTLARAAGL